jgi:hypothetical protein
MRQDELTWEEQMNRIDQRYIAEVQRRGSDTPGIAIDASCMTCGERRKCVRVADIGWLCLDCRQERKS